MTGKKIIERREILKLGGLALIGAASLTGKAASQNAGRLKVLVAGGHPDDPESGCGGTIARYAGSGHEVTVLYLTRGEAGIKGKTHDEAAAIRTRESQEACRILKSRPVFFGQIDGSTEVTPAGYAKMFELLTAEQPDVIFTHWPVDTHRDHRAASMLVYDSWLRLKKRPALYFFEVISGGQTQTFKPTDYIDISTIEEQKRRACFAPQSQKPDEWYSIHSRMSSFRGMEFGCRHAEGFIRHERSPAFSLIR